MTYTENMITRLRREKAELNRAFRKERAACNFYRALALVLAVFLVSVLMFPPEAQASETAWTATVIRCGTHSESCVKHDTQHQTEDACDEALSKAVHRIGPTEDVVVAFCVSDEHETELTMGGQL